MQRSFPYYLAFAVAAVLLLGSPPCLQAEETAATTTKRQQSALTADEIIEGLKAGNARFLDGSHGKHDFQVQIRETSEGQFPAVIALGCIDSRVPVEIVLDAGIGDLFNAGVAGNIANADIAGSMEYACKVVGSKVILVMGHTNCGAVKGAIDDVELGNLTGLLAKIEPAIKAVPDIYKDRTSKNPEFVDAVTRKNVALTIEKIREISPILKTLEEEKAIVIVGALYDVKTGKVEFLP